VVVVVAGVEVVVEGRVGGGGGGGFRLGIKAPGEPVSRDCSTVGVCLKRSLSRFTTHQLACPFKEGWGTRFNDL
jgi:hypothetical protein